MLDLTPGEIVRLVQIINHADLEGVMVFNDDDELTTFESHPDTESLIAKITAEGDREDVKAYIDEKYGTKED
jgi:hypothetical protein